MSHYHFDKVFIAAHTLQAQLAALRDKLQKEYKEHQQAWADTVPIGDENETTRSKMGNDHRRADHLVRHHLPRE